jgi:hypothetical protein
MATMGAMEWPRIVQFLGFVIVSSVLIGALLVGIDDMLFEFGGLAVGMGVFMLGRWMERPAES